MAEIHIYRTYPTGKDGRDPILDEVQEAAEKENLAKKPKTLADLTGISPSTFRNWFIGKTRSPRYATVAAAMAALGYHPKFSRTSRFDLAAERAEAKRWNLRRKVAKAAALERKKATKRKAPSKNNGRDYHVN